MKLSRTMMKHMKKCGEMKGKCRKNGGKIWKNSGKMIISWISIWFLNQNRDFDGEIRI